jgi:hypothetical protein
LVGQQGLRAPQIKIKGFYQKKTSPTTHLTTSLFLCPLKLTLIIDRNRKKYKTPFPLA